MTTISELRSRLSVKLLSHCGKDEGARYVSKLERIVKDSPYGIGPPVWVGSRNDTLLAFIDGAFIAGLCLRMVPMLDPLVIDGADLPFGALLLHEIASRAEGVLIAQGNTEYYFGVPTKATEYLESIEKHSGAEKVSATGVEMFRRDL